jgi:hypothetical protein
VEVLTCYSPKELGMRQVGVKMVALGAIATDFSAGMVCDSASGR